ncbi:TetR/AcrR family transcriptional regulator [Clostridium guangxiense]|uniref:TetR/AcrR family transcriptional regulator n=1 Tax=Clostridium guangxiense TaxID=1662055 RepID=UPI001E44789F|nr:helix-turn-helix domain-containing protein [Clostridium guangxiense]MCD2348629.1 TetR/AcrR family transcriptional regulator [Clostridium guangxiense]
MDKREKIYKAAIKLFNENGLDKTPTSKISKEAGVQLFYYFNTKNELINSIYLKCKESLLNYIKLGIDEEKTYKNKVRKIFINYINWGISNVDEFMFIQQFSNSPYILYTNRKDGIGVFMEFFNEGVKKKVIKSADINYLFWIILSLFNANVQYLISNEDKREDEEFINQSFDFFWSSIKNEH